MLWWSLALSVAIALLLIAVYPVGIRQTLSPGDLASHHARVDVKCAQCHDGAFGDVASLRCERCHDPSGSERLTHSSHVLLGSGNTRLARDAESLNCVQCHNEHRGLASSVRAVDDRECASCHEFSTLAGHPEFAVVRAQATPSVGLRFDHDRHLIKAQEARGATCQVCHELTPDRRGFQPMVFERHCASCHTTNGLLNGETDFIPPEFLLTPDLLPASWRGKTTPELRANPRGRLQATGLQHRDSWVMFNALRLGHGIDPDGQSNERLVLSARIAYLEQLQNIVPSSQVPADQLAAAIEAVRSDLAALDSRIAASADAGDASALMEIGAVVKAVAQQVSAVDPALDAESRDLANVTMNFPAVQPATNGGDTAAARFEQRKAELLKLLDAIDASPNGKTLQERTSGLRTQVQNLSVSGVTSDQDASTLLDRLNALDEALRAVASIPDPGLQTELGNVDLLRRYARQRISAGLSPGDFETRRAELLQVLDAITRRGDPAIRVRAAALRQRVTALRPGSDGDAELREERARRQKQLDRLVLEQELANSPRDAEPAPAQDAIPDQAGIANALQKLRANLSNLQRAPRMTAAADGSERELRQQALESLLGPCTKCHVLDGSRARLSPVRISEVVMPRSIFNHAPHTTQTACETCHGSTATSKLATDVNVPNVASCQTCHAPGKSRAECETCHVYHPSSPAAFLMVQR